MQTNRPRKHFQRWSKTSLYHWYKLLGRSVFLLLAVIAQILSVQSGTPVFSFKEPVTSVLLWIVWLLFMVEMVLRLYPSPLESMGSQKQFKENWKLGEDIRSAVRSIWQNRTDLFSGSLREMLIGRRVRGRTTVLIVWLLLNGGIAALFFTGVINEGVLLIIALFYSVCDMICILFFCPFQTWFMKNRCCANCYIYNWDYAMMFTPLLLIPHVYTWTLAGMSLIVLLQWEVRLRLWPERFDIRTNAALRCSNCSEKLCRHKKQLQGFIRTLEKSTRLENAELLNTILGQNNRFDEDDKED